MKIQRLIAAAAVLFVTGAAFAAPSTDTGTSPASSTAPTGFTTDMTYDLGTSTSSREFSFAASSAEKSSFDLPYSAAGGGGQAKVNDLGTIWVLTDLSYELPSSSSTTVELGFGWYGVGGGLNFYPEGGHHGLMISARVGWTGSGGVAANAAVNYVGHFSPQILWRLGVGVEYQSDSGWLHGWTDVFPIGIADVGFRL